MCKPFTRCPLCNHLIHRTNSEVFYTLSLFLFCLPSRACCDEKSCHANQGRQPRQARYLTCLPLQRKHRIRTQLTVCNYTYSHLLIISLKSTSPRLYHINRQDINLDLREALARPTSTSNVSCPDSTSSRDTIPTGRLSRNEPPQIARTYFTNKFDLRSARRTNSRIWVPLSLETFAYVFLCLISGRAR